MVRPHNPLRNSTFFLAASTLTALVVRTIPEILSWPYPLGFDTVAYYLPTMIRGTYVNLSFAAFRSRGFFYWTITILYKALGDPFVTIKVLGVSLYAAFALTVYLYSWRGFNLTPKTCFISGLLASLSLLSLRLGWDLYRNLLGLTLSLATLLAATSEDLRVKFISVPLGFLAVWIHELTTVYLVISLIALTLSEALKKNVRESLLYVAVMLVPAAFFAYQMWDPYKACFNFPIRFSAPQEFSNGVLAGVELLLFTSWPLMLLAVPALKRADATLQAWSGTSLVFGLILPLTGVFTVPPRRLWLMLAFPLPIYAACGAEKLFRRGIATRIFALALIALTALTSIGYVVTSPENPLWIFKQVPQLYGCIPSAYLQNTVPVEQTGELIATLEMAEVTLNPDDVLILPEQFYGFAYATLKGSDLKLVNAGRASLEAIVEMGNSYGGGGGSAYTVWWSRPYGWYNVATIPEGLVPYASNGHFAIYKIEVIS